jgi:hypothetical protein
MLAQLFQLPALETYRFLGEEERCEPQADPRRAFVCLQALGIEKSVRQDRAPRSIRSPKSAT